MYDTEGADIVRGRELMQTNCTACHNSVGAGGALGGGRYAPPITGVEPRHIYEAMLTGPQSMPVFDDELLLPEDKRNIIAYIETIEDAAALRRGRSRWVRPGQRGSGRLGGRHGHPGRVRDLDRCQDGEGEEEVSDEHGSRPVRRAGQRGRPPGPAG